MADERILALIDRQDWLENSAGAIQTAVSSAFEAAGEAGQQIKDALHGTWLGHPVHAAVTSVPVGAWTAAVVMDAIDELSPNNGLKRGADAAVAVGLAGAAISAVTGLADWSAVDGRARKAGLVHGAMNLAAAGLFTASLFLRHAGRRAEARALGALGFAVAAGSAWLGGELVYKEQIGVNHAAGLAFPKEFTAVLAESELAEGRMLGIENEGARILLAKRDGKVYAMADVCSHLGGPLSQGTFEDGQVTCPWHGSCFSFADGSVVHGPAVHAEPVLECRTNNGQIEIRRL